VCSGWRNTKESVSAIFWCAVKIWIRTAVTKTVVLLLNNLNGIKKHVEDISVDAALGCKFCSVVIYDAKYNIKNFIILTAISSPYHQYHSGDINWVLQVFLLHIISINMSALPHWEVGDKQQWSDNRDYVTVEFPKHVIMYVLKSDYDKTLEKPKRCCCTVR